MTNLARTLEILDRLVAFDTVSAKPTLGIIAFLEDFLAERGFAVNRIAGHAGEKAGLYAEIGPRGPGILLSGHVDVVPADGQRWTRPPFRLTREVDRVYGRGTTDMKGFLACTLVMAEAAALRRLTEPLKLVFSYDEEVGCLGIREMLGQLTGLVGVPRACIVGEPTGLAVAVGHKGKAAFRAICHGQSGHSALAPHFVNALHLATEFVSALRGLQDDIAAHGVRDPGYDIPFATVHVGRLSGGTALNIVPDRAELDFEVRHLADDKIEAIEARLVAAAQRSAAPFRDLFTEARIEIELRNAYPGLATPSDAPVVALVRRFASDDRVTKVAFGTEAGYFHGLGIPTVVCGPGSMEGQGHKPDEYITVQQLGSCDRMMTRILEELAG